MKILTEGLLREYGFMGHPAKSSTKVKVMTRNDFYVNIKVDEIYHPDLGNYYPLRDTSTLRKKYKDASGKDLKPINPSIIY